MIYVISLNQKHNSLASYTRRMSQNIFNYCIKFVNLNVCFEFTEIYR